jgi:hypothetical protein
LRWKTMKQPRTHAVATDEMILPASVMPAINSS